MSATFPYSVNCGMLFTEVPYLDRPAAAREAGFTAVELRWPFGVAVPRSSQIDRFVEAVGDADVEVVSLSCFGGDLASGDRGIVSWPGRESELRENVEIVAKVGERLGCTLFNAHYGKRQPGVSPDLQDELAIENLRFAGQTFDRVGGAVMLEPLSGHDGYPLLTAADVVRVIDRVEQATGVTNVRILADLYHLVANGDDVDGMIATYTDYIGHVQIADSPGRHEPGTGGLPLQRWMSDLRAAGYDGWIGLEYHPRTTTLEGLARLA